MTATTQPAQNSAQYPAADSPAPAAPDRTYLTGPLVTLRPPVAEDAAPLLEILGEPEVSLWWVGYTAERVQDEIIARGDVARIIEVDGRCAGALFVYRGDDPEYPTTVMHIFIGTAFRGRRIGEEAIALATAREFADGVTRITLDPNIYNEGAIRSYERLGFRRIGVLRDYQVRPGGALEDALFMDLTRRDFPAGPPLPERE